MNNKVQEIGEKIYLIDSQKEGKTVTIMAGVHGNEYIGINIVNKLLKNIKIDFGKVYFVIANLKAIKENKREIEKNMNRCFLKENNGNTYEEKRAIEIMKILDKSDYLLDLHNTFSKENSVKFLISEYQDLGKIFNVPYVIFGFDELHPGGSDSYINNIGKKGICLEAGSLYDKDGKEGLEKLVEESVYNFLKFTKNIDGNIKKYNNQSYIKFDFIYKNKTNNFVFSKKYKDFEKVKKGEVIAFDGDKKVISQYNGYILFAFEPNKIGSECFCLGKI